jgi:hypothetical protein
MPVNPNIALGVQPIQQPNILGQMGQAMALRAAQQETEGYEGVKNALSGGMSATDPRILQYGKRGIEAFRAAGEGRVKQIEVAKKQNEVLGSIFGGVLQDPTTGPQAVSRLVEMGVMSGEQAQRVIEQAGNNPDAWRKLARPYYEGAIDAEKRLTAETSIKTANISAGATMRGQDLTDKRAREQMEFERNKRTVREGDDGFIQQDAFGNLYRVEGYGALRGPNAPAPAMPPAAANAFVTTAQPSVNALAPTAPQAVQPGSPTVANALATEAQNNVPRPKQPFRAASLTDVDDPFNKGQKLRVDANVYKQGTGLGAPGVLGVASTSKLTPAQEQKLKGEISKDFEAVTKTIQETNGLLESIDAVKSSNLDAVSGPVSARTPTIKNESLTAETRFENLKGKVTAIAKAAASMSGAIGSIANQEWQILANQIAVLDLKKGSTANLEQIEQLERQALSIANRMRDGFERKYGADVETLAPQYKELPNVNYTPGQYTTTGKKTSSVDSTNPWLK